jgi:Mlc titration factor MtfA (ptsG expression regulator)
LAIPIFHLLADHRWKKLTQAPFPAEWAGIICRNVAHYCMLDDAERAHLRSLIQVFIAEKHWEGAEGLELTYRGIWGT